MLMSAAAAVGFQAHTASDAFEPTEEAKAKAERYLQRARELEKVAEQAREEQMREVDKLSDYRKVAQESMISREWEGVYSEQTSQDCRRKFVITGRDEKGIQLEIRGEDGVAPGVNKRSCEPEFLGQSGARKVRWVVKATVPDPYSSEIYADFTPRKAAGITSGKVSGKWSGSPSAGLIEWSDGTEWVKGLNFNQRGRDRKEESLRRFNREVAREYERLKKEQQAQQGP